MIEWLDQQIVGLANLFPDETFFSLAFNIRGMLAVILVSLVCGAVGSLVVGNRMAFFSDALAHCAFAGIALGLMMGVLTGATTAAFHLWITLAMIIFGVTVGLAIAFVREVSGQANDTVIGVFFAGAIGLGAVFLKVGSGRRIYPPEDFLFGNLVTVETVELVVLFLLAVCTAVVLAWVHNDLALASVNRSLALSRRVRVRLVNSAFIVLLAVIVSLCLKIVGALLINALLIVPAATAALLCRNLRQMFWGSVVLCLLAGVGGHLLSWHIQVPVVGTRHWTHAGESGVIVLLSVTLYFVALAGSPLLARWRKKAAA